MTKHFCDLCGAETTDAPRLWLEIDRVSTPSPYLDLPPALAGRLHKYEVCRSCAIRAIEKVPKKVSK